jgi:hypothetical protein
LKITLSPVDPVGGLDVECIMAEVLLKQNKVDLKIRSIARTSSSHRKRRSRPFRSGSRNTSPGG